MALQHRLGPVAVPMQQKLGPVTVPTPNCQVTSQKLCLPTSPITLPVVYTPCVNDLSIPQLALSQIEGHYLRRQSGAALPRKCLCLCVARDSPPRTSSFLTQNAKTSTS